MDWTDKQTATTVYPPPPSSADQDRPRRLTFIHQHARLILLPTPPPPPPAHHLHLLALFTPNTITCSIPLNTSPYSRRFPPTFSTWLRSAASLLSLATVPAERPVSSCKCTWLQCLYAPQGPMLTAAAIVSSQRAPSPRFATRALPP